MARRLLASDERMKLCSRTIEEFQDAGEAQLGIGTMQRAQHQVAGFGRLDGGQHRLAVAHFANQNRIRVLPHDDAQGIVKIGHVQADFALRDDALLSVECKFNRVLDRDDVQTAVMLMYSIIAASVELLPEPVTPHTKTKPSMVSLISLR